MTSLEISKQLYAKFPEWDDTQQSWAEVIDKTATFKPLLRVTSGSNSAWQETPAYDSDYLLNKMPSRTDRIEDTMMLGRATNNNGWSAVYRDFCCIADTPANALALLAIKLREDGVL